MAQFSGIPEIKGIDVEIFLKDLNEKPTKEEIKAIREWAFS